MAPAIWWEPFRVVGHGRQETVVRFPLGCPQIVLVRYAGLTGLMRTQRMQVQNAEQDARSCGNEYSATQRISPDQPFDGVRTGGI